MSAGNFGLGWSCRAADAGLVLGVELGLDGLELAPCEVGERQGPHEIPLPYGLTVTVKPLTTAGMAAAQAAARRAVEAIERQARERAENRLVSDEPLW